MADPRLPTTPFETEFVQEQDSLTGPTGRQPINGLFSHQLEVAQFQADLFFVCVAYPYWQQPYNVPVWNVPRVEGAGTYHHQSNLGIVGRPLGINDWNTPLQTPYGVLPDELQ